MRKIFLVAMVLASTFMFAQNRELNNYKLNTHNGFKSCKFGLSIDVIPNLIFIESGKKNRNLKFYERTDEVRMIGKYHVDKVIYGFYNNKLCLLNIKFKEKKAKNLIKLDKNVLGTGYDERKVQEDYYFDGKQIILK